MHEIVNVNEIPVMDQEDEIILVDMGQLPSRNLRTVNAWSG